MNDMSAADIAALAKQSDDSFGSGGMWIFALLILLMVCGSGNGFFGNSDKAATAADVQRSQDFTAIERQMNEGVSATRQGVYDVTGAVKDGNYNMLSELRDLQSETTTGFANQQTQFCATQRSIDSVKYDMANYAAQLDKSFTAQIQQLRDENHQAEKDAMRAQINQLQMQSMLCGIPKMSPYGYAMYPTWPNPAPVNPPYGPVA